MSRKRNNTPSAPAPAPAPVIVGEESREVTPPPGEGETAAPTALTIEGWEAMDHEKRVKAFLRALYPAEEGDSLSSLGEILAAIGDGLPSPRAVRVALAGGWSVPSRREAALTARPPSVIAAVRKAMAGPGDDEGKLFALLACRAARIEAHETSARHARNVPEQKETTIRIKVEGDKIKGVKSK